MAITPLKVLVCLAIAYLAVWILELQVLDNYDPEQKLLLEGLTSHPPPVNTTKLLQHISSVHKSIAHEHGHAKAGFPFLDSQHYLSTLSTYASLTKVKRVLVVIGPKGSGKSEGILKMIPVWTKLGHIVLDYNFDHIGEVENILAKKTADAFKRMNSTVLECYHANMVPECGVRTTIRLKAGEYFNISIPTKQGDPKWILLLIGVVVIAIATLKPAWLTIAWGIFTPKLSKWLIIPAVFVFILVTLALGYVLSSYWLWIDALEDFIVNENLRALTCTCSVISKCIPDQQPILIARHYDGVNTTNALFRILKRGMGTFPVIVEASDFRWGLSPAVVQSREYFIQYYLRDMSFEEGKAQLVDQYNIWSLTEYEKVYQSVGGHMGSLRLLFDYHKVMDMTLDEATSHMKEIAYNQIVNVLTAVKQPDTVLSMIQTIVLDGVLEVITVGNDPEILADIQILSDTNIIFVTAAGGKMYPQNELMKWGMKQVLRYFLTQNLTSTKQT